MKKYFYLAAVSAMMLTACSSENDVVQPTPAQPTNPVAVQQQAVAFDTYLSGTTASTRAGDPTGVMTTDKLKTPGKGFGVFAMHQQGTTYAAAAPNFMYNEHVSWNSGWTYSPLKYWPNETTNDSQTPTAASTGTPNNDYLSFFAYAPYVDHTTLTGQTKGITAISANTFASDPTDPTITWAYSTDADENVDLLWGVAPAGFSYTNVSGSTTSVPFGMPLKDLIKPDKDQKVKFLFQHALSRIGLSVVSAIDQIAAGDDAGTFSSDPTTKVLIKSVTISGNLGKTGTLNLNNTVSNEARWTVTAEAATFTIDDTHDLAPDLRYNTTQIGGITSTSSTFDAVNAGVLPSEQALLSGDADPSKKVGEAASEPAFEWGKTYYKEYAANTGNYVLANTSYTASADLFTYDATTDKYTQAYSAGTIKLDGNSVKLYTVDTTTPIAAAATLDTSKKYYKKTEVDGKTIYTVMDGTGLAAGVANTYYEKTASFGAVIDIASTKYSSAQYWTGLIPRYFMVIPTGNTSINVNIKYAVVTYDTKLNGNVSNVENDITKTVTVDLKNGKSYNLKLILGLTSVKLDATVADWKVADETEVYLPQNNQ